MKRLKNFTFSAICLTFLFTSFNSYAETTPPSTLVIFGASGDLTGRKLLPALYNLSLANQLSEETAIIGFARAENSDEGFRSQCLKALEQHSRTQPVDLDFYKKFEGKIFYNQGQFDQDASYEKLKEIFARTPTQRVYYLATQPSYFPLIIEKLQANGLLSNAKIVLEKPFGYDLESAQQLQSQISKYVDESHIYRMDHYLGKAGTQDLFNLRFKNSIFEPIWNREEIDHVQISLSEEIGIGTRGRFWESTGLLRDIFQNHLIQLLTLVAMEAPKDFSPKSIHDEKIRVLGAIRPLNSSDVIRGQYAGYRQENGVSSTSTIETYIAAKIFFDNPRWKDVPFYVRSGKRLPTQSTTVAVAFKNGNLLQIRIQPNPGIFLKIAGSDSWVPVESAKAAPEAYEKLLSDILHGDKSSFVQVEEQLAAWKLLSPLLKQWRDFPETVPQYDEGTWGPSSADQLIKEDGREWIQFS